MKKMTKNKVNKDHSAKKSAPIKKREQENKLDRALEETFPASDPITRY